MCLRCPSHERFRPRRARKAELCGRGDGLYVRKQHLGKLVAECAENGHIRPAVLVELVRCSQEIVGLGYGDTNNREPAAAVFR